MNIRPLKGNSVITSPSLRNKNSISFKGPGNNSEGISMLFEFIATCNQNPLDSLKYLDINNALDHIDANITDPETKQCLFEWLIRLRGNDKLSNNKDAIKMVYWRNIAEVLLRCPNFNPNKITQDKISLIELALKNNDLILAKLLKNHPKFKKPNFTDYFIEKKYEALCETEMSSANYRAGKTNNPLKNSDNTEITAVLAKYLMPNTKYDPKSLNDIGGMSEAKDEINEFIVKPWNPRYRQKIEDNHIEMPNGFLMYGPPGCGKTYIVKAISNEMHIPVFKLDMSQVGGHLAYQSEKEMANIFNALEAKFKKTNSPSILFLDEMDTICGSRKKSHTDWRRDEINTMLQFMNNAAQRGIILIGATNLIENLDDAVLRTGRFDKKIFIGKPNAQERYEIIAKLSRKSPIARNAMKYIKSLVDMTEDSTCSDINALFQHTMRTAIYDDKNSISLKDFQEAHDSLKFDMQKENREIKGFALKD